MTELKKIGIVKSDCYAYPSKQTLFRPDELYPEYFFSAEAIAKSPNKVYSMVREGLFLMGLDKEHYGFPDWNPLGKYISPGNYVLIKPNLVMEKNGNDQGTDCLYTHPSVVAAMIDYVLIALKGKGKIIVGDAPMQECKFDILIKESGYQDLIDWYVKQGYDVELKDFRQLTSDVRKDGLRVQHIKKTAEGEIIDLGKDSEFFGIDNMQLDKMRITNYDPEILKQHHLSDKHEYFISDYVLKADCIINMPKPKTHRKAGVTIAMKNFVGINVRKEFLPHHTLGSVSEGGDEYLHKSFLHALRSKLLDKKNHWSAVGKNKKAEFYKYCIKVPSLLMKFDKRNCFSEGSWYGNHTISRTIMDLNKIVMYAGKDGAMYTTPQRNVFIAADMIVSGEKEGPIEPSPKKVGIIAMGDDLVCFDEAVCTLMGFDVNKIPTINSARLYQGKYPITGQDTCPVYCSNSLQYDQKSPASLSRAAQLKFIPTSGWAGKIEL